jgi:phosphate transport system permease protein
MENVSKYFLRRRITEKIAFAVIAFLSILVIAILFIILGFILSKGAHVVSWKFITSMPEDGMTKGGIYPAIVGTLCLIEYNRAGFFKKFIKLMTNNLAGVPSIVFGLFGMALFVNTMKFGDSLIAGSLTLGLMALPVIIRTTEESLKSIDDSFRHASYALGATKWTTVSKVVLPIAMPNILTGVILSIGRVSGETAPILFTVAAYFLPRLPSSIHDQVMALPYHLYVISTSGTNIKESREMAYGTAVVLILIVLILNLMASALRKYLGKRTNLN